MPLMSSTCPFKFVSTVCRSAPSFSSPFSPRAPALSLLTFSWVRGLKFPSSIPKSPVNVTFFRNGVLPGGIERQSHRQGIQSYAPSHDLGIQHIHGDQVQSDDCHKDDQNSSLVNDSNASCERRQQSQEYT